MGNQAGNLRAQLVNDGVCHDMDAAKSYVRSKLVVQVLVVHEDKQRASLEYVMLAVLQPKYCD